MRTGPLQVYLDDLGQVVVTDGDPRPNPWTPRQVAYVAPPTAADLFRWLGWPAPDEEQAQAAQAHLDRARLLVIAYTRGRGTHGDHLAEEMAAVVLSAASRSMNNPTSDARFVAGQYASTPGQPDWTLQERLVLDGFRRKVA